MRPVTQSALCATAIAVLALSSPWSAAWAQSRQGGTGGSGGNGGQGGAQQQMHQQQRQAERSMNQQQAGDRDRMQERERDRTQAEAKPHAATGGVTGIYGGNLMTEQERARYREQRGLLKTDQERAQFEARHREQMQMRAKERGVEPVVTEN